MAPHGHLMTLGKAATCIKVQDARTRDGRREITIARHLHIDGLADRQGDGGAITDVIRGGVVATNINGLGLGHRSQRRQHTEQK